MNKLKISKRLQCAGEYARKGSFIADIGTDHAYLPILLVLEEQIRGGVVSDINKGPILRAKENIKNWQVGDLLTPVLCDGLSVIEPYSPEDIFILGMGGELIADIISRAPWTKDKKIRLILQPMTHAEILRGFLLKEGYSIVDECLVKDDKIYQIICAEYSGEVENYSYIEMMFGKKNLERRDALADEMLCRWTDILTHRRDGKAVSGTDTSNEDTLLREIENIKKEWGKK